MVDTNDLFRGWINKNDADGLRQQAYVNLRVRIATIESFSWSAGGDICYRGDVEVLTSISRGTDSTHSV